MWSSAVAPAAGVWRSVVAGLRGAPDDPALLETFDAALAGAQVDFDDDARALWPAVRYALWRYLRRAAAGRVRPQSFNPFACDDVAGAGASWPTTPPGAADVLIAAPPAGGGGAATGVAEQHAEALAGRWRVARVAMLGRAGERPPAGAAALAPPPPAEPGARERAAAESGVRAARALGLRLDAGLLAGHLAAYRALVDAWDAALVAARPRLALFVALGRHMALAEAASRRGVPCAELQHGVIRRISALHRGWGAAPPGGWPGLPREIWCWTPQDARWAAEALSGSTNAVAVGRAAPRSVRTDPLRRPPRRMVVALQEQKALPAAIAAAIRSRPDIAWTIAPHPRLDRFDRRGVPPAARVAGTDEPLAALLARNDGLVTRDSATVYDAAALGAPAWVVGASGARAFAEEIAAGAVGRLDDPSGLDSIPTPAPPPPFDPSPAAARLMEASAENSHA